MAKIAILFLICLCLTACSGRKSNTTTHINEDMKQKLILEEVEDYAKRDGVIGWCGAYLNGSFEKCDVLAVPNTDRLQTFYYSDEAKASTMSIDTYKLLLKKSSEALESIEYVENTGNSVTLRVKFHTYKAIDDFKLKSKDYSKLSKKYLSTEQTLTDYQKQFADLVLKDYETYFNMSSEVSEMYFVLTENREEAVVKVENTQDFVFELLKAQGIQDIESVFENKLKTEIQRVCKDI